MPRIARCIISNIPYHIIHRGNNHQKIFYSETDYKYFLSLLKEAKEKHPCRIYSYVLMVNHFHILLESHQEADNISKFIKLIAQKYAQYINRYHDRTGTLWEGRFKSIPVARDNYLLTCSRYIELNPVRACLVKAPKDYRWSSYRFKIGEKSNFTLLDRDPVYGSLSNTDEGRQRLYREWIEASIAPTELDSLREVINKGGALRNIVF